MNVPKAIDIYELGVWLGYLEAVVSPEGIIWSRVRESLQYLSKYKDVEGLDFIGGEAKSELSTLARTYKYSYNRVFSKIDCADLNTMVHQWYGRLDEIKKRWFIGVPETNSLDVSKLSSGAKSFFEENEWSLLNELEQHGLNEAATCLLVNNFTSSEFMALRSLESVLRRWYESKTGKPVEKIKQINIFEMINEEFPDIGRPKEISALFHLKNRRNAIAHPEVISTVEDANATFIYSISTCKAVNKFIEK